MGLRLKLLKLTDDAHRAAMEGLRPVEEFGAELRMAASEMVRVMCHERGIGLTGPQVGLPLRLAVMNAGLDGGFHVQARDLKMANPEVVWRSEETTTEDESSLSMRGVVFQKTRPKKIKARWSDLRTGEVKTRDMNGREARVFCHLVETLDGGFFPRDAEAAASTTGRRDAAPKEEAR